MMPMGEMWGLDEDATPCFWNEAGLNRGVQREWLLTAEYQLVTFCTSLVVPTTRTTPDGSLCLTTPAMLIGDTGVEIVFWGRMSEYDRLLFTVWLFAPAIVIAILVERSWSRCIYTSQLLSYYLSSTSSLLRTSNQSYEYGSPMACCGEEAECSFRLEVAWSQWGEKRMIDFVDSYPGVIQDFVFKLFSTMQGFSCWRFQDAKFADVLGH